VRVGPYTRLSRIWQIVMCTLGADALVVLFVNSHISPGHAEVGAVLCALLTLPFLNQRAIAHGMANLRALTRKPDHRTQRIFSALLVVVLGLIITSKLLAFSRVDNLLGATFTALIVIGIVSSIRTMLAHRQAQAKQLAAAPWEHIPLWERQLVVTAAMPMVTARLVSLFGALSTQNSQVTGLTLTTFGTSLVLLLILKPNRATYVGHCARCKTPVPIAFVQFGSCPACDQELGERLFSR
jgi:hypothetical protein